MPVLAARDWIAGAILWCYQDYKSRRNLWPGQTEGYVEHGVVDEARQRKPSYAVWRELNAPAKIDVDWVGPAGTGFIATVTPNSQNNLPYYPLHGYLLKWNVFDDKGKAVAGGKQPYEELTRAESVTGSLPADAGEHALHLKIALENPAGVVAAERVLDWPASPAK